MGAIRHQLRLEPPNGRCESILNAKSRAISRAPAYTLGMILNAGSNVPSSVGGHGIASNWSNTT